MDTSIMKASDIANFTKTNYAQLASHARGLIVKDMNKGVLQNGEHKYKKDKKGISRYARKKATGALGKFRKSDKVTMLLSGETARRIRPEGKKDRATLVFERGDIVKWNEDNNNYATTPRTDDNDDDLGLDIIDATEEEETKKTR